MEENNHISLYCMISTFGILAYKAELGHIRKTLQKVQWKLSIRYLHAKRVSFTPLGFSSIYSGNFFACCQNLVAFSKFS
jgi:hypothetical protein